MLRGPKQAGTDTFSEARLGLYSALDGWVIKGSFKDNVHL
jgi:hypothetical protein